MTEACFVTAVTPVGTFALSSTDKTNKLLDPNKNTISRICLFITYVKLTSAYLLRRVFFALRNFTETVFTLRLPFWLSALRGIKRSTRLV